MPIKNEVEKKRWIFSATLQYLKEYAGPGSQIVMLSEWEGEKMVGITVAVAVFPGRGGSQVVSTDPQPWWVSDFLTCDYFMQRVEVIEIDRKGSNNAAKPCTSSGRRSQFD